jgi:hypothetical protein
VPDADVVQVVVVVTGTVVGVVCVVVVVDGAVVVLVVSPDESSSPPDVFVVVVVVVVVGVVVVVATGMVVEGTVVVFLGKLAAYPTKATDASPELKKTLKVKRRTRAKRRSRCWGVRCEGVIGDYQQVLQECLKTTQLVLKKIKRVLTLLVFSFVTFVLAGERQRKACASQDRIAVHVNGPLKLGHHLGDNRKP